MMTFAISSACRATVCALATAAALASLPLRAADAGSRFVVRGAGSASCETFRTALREPKEAMPYIAWLIGFATATNKLTANTFDVIPTDDGMEFARAVGVVCAANRNANLATAAGWTIDALAPLRQTAETPFLVLSFEGKSVRVRQGAVKLLAQGLSARQLYRGDTSGQPSNDLYKAIKALQEKEKLAVTGLPDMDTFIRAVVKR